MFSVRFPICSAIICGCAALAAPASPVCEVQASAQLEDYSVSSGARGLLSVNVRCPDTVRYMLRIENDGLPINGPDATLLLKSSAGLDVQARVEIHGVPLSTVFSGTQNFSLSLNVAPGQWGLIGTRYAVMLGINAEQVDDGAHR